MPRLPKNIIKRGNRFYYRSREGGIDRRVSLGPNLQEAKRKALLLFAGQDRDVPPEPEDNCPTVATFSKRWLSEYIRQSRNAGGLDLAERRFKKHTLPVLGDLRLDQVTTTDLRQFRGVLEAKKLARFTVRHILSDVRCFFRYAVEVSVIAESPFRLSVMPKVPEIAPRSLTDEELAKVLAATPAEFETAVHLAVLTGLRWGELRRLQWRHVSPGDTPYLVLDRTKSGKVRRVPLIPEAVRILEQERDRSRSSFVLPKRPAKTIDFVAPMREAVGFYWTFHQLRHTFACQWLDAGGSKEALQKILGHSTITMTERYGRLSDEAVFAEARGRSLGRPANGGTVVGTLSGTVANFGNDRTS